MEITSDDIEDIKKLAAQISDSDVQTRFPDNPDVELPGGFIAKDGSVVKYATVRELTGRDEEFIARGGNKSIMLNNILVRGVERLGYNAPSSNDLDSLLAGDRDALLLGIRKVTFGAIIDGSITCPSCAEKQDVVIDLDTDIEYTELADPLNDRVFEINLKAGKTEVGLPTGAVQKRLADSMGKTAAERLTILLNGCLIAINDEPCNMVAADLGIVDRETLLEEIVKRNPGPRLEAVIKACKACGTDIAVPLSLADLFRL